jgi:hypothetical protein
MNHRLSISAGTVDITPQHPLMLGGYSKRTVPYTGVGDRLEANVLIMDGNASRVVIVSTDLLYPGEALRNKLLDALNLTADQDRLFLCASHTHYAPMTAASMPRLGVVEPAYVQFVAARIAALVKSIEGTATPCVCTYHEGQANHSVNRRLRCLRLTRRGLSRGIGMGPNPLGRRDERVRILKFSAAGGEPLALIWNYACHATDSLDLLKVSAAYPGTVRSRLRSDLGPVPILFLQGFSGNVRPPFAGITYGVKGILRRVILGPQFRTPPRRSEWEVWSSSLAASVASFARSAPRPLCLRSPIARRIELPEHEFAVGGDGDKALVWHLIDCGEFRIVGVNAEPVVEYRELLASRLGNVPFLTAGCLDQTRCYLPTGEMIREGGYEVEGFRPLFNFKGHFRQNLEEPILRMLGEAVA